MSRRGRRRLPATLLAGASLVGLVAAAALAGPAAAPHDPLEQLDPAEAQLLPPGSTRRAVRLASGSWKLGESVVVENGSVVVERRSGTLRLERADVVDAGEAGRGRALVFPLGTDKFGRDLLSRLLHGARVSLSVALLATVLALGLGTAVGGVAASTGGLADAALMRLADGLLAFPRLFLLLLLAALFEPNRFEIALVLGATGWMGVSRLVRAEVLRLGESDFVAAARGLGQDPLRTFTRHVLPNALAPVLVDGALRVGAIVLLEATLSFLGLVSDPSAPSWGTMVADGRDSLLTAWWVALVPGAAITVTVVAFNLLGDGLRDALDPRRAG